MTPTKRASMTGKFGGIFASMPLPMVGAVFCIMFAYVGTIRLWTLHHKPYSSMLYPLWLHNHESLQLASGAVGISSLQFCNMNLQRNIFIIGFSIFMAFSVPEYFEQYTLAAGHGPSHSRAHWVGEPPSKIIISWYSLIETLNNKNLFFPSSDSFSFWRSVCWELAVQRYHQRDVLVKCSHSDDDRSDTWPNNEASRKDRGLLWWDKFSTFSSDPRNLEFYKLPMGLNKFFPPTWCITSWCIPTASNHCYDLKLFGREELHASITITGTGTCCGDSRSTQNAPLFFTMRMN